MSHRLIMPFLLLSLLPVIPCHVYFGIDVSGESGPVDWSAVIAPEVTPKPLWTFIKGSEGSEIDQRFRYNFEEARKHVYHAKFYHVFRIQRKDKNGRARDISVTSQIAAIQQNLQFVQNITDSAFDSMEDEFAIHVKQVHGDAGLSGKFPNTTRTFQRLSELIAGVKKLGLDPIIRTSKPFWDANVYAGTDVSDDVRGVWLDQHEPEDLISSIPLDKCECAIAQYAPVVNGSDAASAYPLGLHPRPGSDEDDGNGQASSSPPSDDEGEYYWNFGEGSVAGVSGKKKVGFNFKIHPNKRMRYFCTWSPSDSSSSATTAATTLSQSHDMRCDKKLVNTVLGIALPRTWLINLVDRG